MNVGHRDSEAEGFFHEHDAHVNHLLPIDSPLVL